MEKEIEIDEHSDYTATIYFKDESVDPLTIKGLSHNDYLTNPEYGHTDIFKVFVDKKCWTVNMNEVLYIVWEAQKSEKRTIKVQVENDEKPKRETSII